MMIRLIETKKGKRVAKELTIEECRELLGCNDVSDQEVEELLTSLRQWIDGFLDDYLQEK